MREFRDFLMIIQEKGGDYFILNGNMAKISLPSIL